MRNATLGSELPADIGKSTSTCENVCHCAIKSPQSSATCTPPSAELPDRHYGIRC